MPTPRHFSPDEAADALQELEDAIRKVRDMRGDDRCWRDWEAVYALLPEGYTPPARDETVELDLCAQYIRSCHDPKVSYTSPQRRIEELEEANDALKVCYLDLQERYADLEAEKEKLLEPMRLFGAASDCSEMDGRPIPPGTMILLFPPDEQPGDAVCELLLEFRSEAKEAREEARRLKADALEVQLLRISAENQCAALHGEVARLQKLTEDLAARCAGQAERKEA